MLSSCLIGVASRHQGQGQRQLRGEVGWEEAIYKEKGMGKGHSGGEGGGGEAAASAERRTAEAATAGATTGAGAAAATTEFVVHAHWSMQFSNIFIAMKSYDCLME